MQQQYLERTGSGDIQGSKADSGPGYVRQNDCDCLMMTDINVTDRLGIKRGSPCTSNPEEQKAHKHFIDAREVCLLEWDLRDRTVDEFGLVWMSLGWCS